MSDSPWADGADSQAGAVSRRLGGRAAARAAELRAVGARGAPRAALELLRRRAPRVVERAVPVRRVLRAAALRRGIGRHVVVGRGVAELERQDHRAVDRHGQPAVSAPEHDGADDELRERVEGAGEGVVGLKAIRERRVRGMDEL